MEKSANEKQTTSHLPIASSEREKCLKIVIGGRLIVISNETSIVRPIMNSLALWNKRWNRICYFYFFYRGIYPARTCNLIKSSSGGCFAVISY